jgi:Uma2 family endonuclease
MRNKILAKHDSAREPAMSQPAVSALAPLPFELVFSDGEPLESEWHVRELHLLLDVITQAMAEQGRADFYVGGNMFVYYSVEQARGVWQEEMRKGMKKTAFRGPDVFFVDGVDRHERKGWVAWEEDGRLPDVIFEMLSPSTAENDRTKKRSLYEKVFRTAEYFLCDPDTGELEGLRLAGQANPSYRPILPDEKGRLWSEQLGAFVGLWRGVVSERKYAWVRLFRPDGTLVPTPEELAKAQRERADAERQRADAAEAELARLRALLEERGGS